MGGGEGGGSDAGGAGVGKAISTDFSSHKLATKSNRNFNNGNLQQQSGGSRGGSSGGNVMVATLWRCEALVTRGAKFEKERTVTRQNL